MGEDIIDFESNSTKGLIITNKIENNILLFSYPEDFSYISEFEIIELQKNIREFEKLNTTVLLIGYGNMLSHYAWIEAIKMKTGIEITIPILEDKLNEIARKYGMVYENLITNKVVIIGKDRKIKVIQDYAQNIPRNIYEIKRIIQMMY